MRLIMVSSDKALLEENSKVRERLVSYSQSFKEVYVVLFCLKKNSAGVPEVVSVGKSFHIYPTKSYSKLLFIFDAFWIGLKIIRRIRPSRLTGKIKVQRCAVTAQDPFEAGKAGWLISRLGGFSLELQVHTDFLNPYFGKMSLLNKFRVSMARFLIPRADIVRAVSSRVADSIRATGLSDHVYILPVALDTRSIVAAAKSNLFSGYPQYKFSIFTAARLEPEKNLSLAISALAVVMRKYPLAGLFIAGTGSQRSALESFSRRLGVDSNVVFLGARDDVVSLTRAANVYLSTSFYEGYGLSMAQAAVVGTPIVATEAGIVGELGRVGAAVVCQIHDAECVAAGIIGLLENNETRERVRSEARTAIASLIVGRKKYMSVWLAALEKIIDKRSRR